MTNSTHIFCGNTTKHRSERGFTLIELMVVMVIAAVLVTAVSMTLKRDYQDLANEEMKRLRALVTLSRDEAIFQARSLAIGFTRKSYVFMVKSDENKWQAMDDSQFRKRNLPKNFELEVIRSGIPVDYMEKKEGKPQVFIFSTGEVSPFKINISYPGKASVSIQFDALGDSMLLTEE